MLSRNAIKSLMKSGHIKVTPDPVRIGPNSIDLRMGDTLKMYHPHDRQIVFDPIDGKRYNAINPSEPPCLVDVPKLSDGKWLLKPGQFYLGATLERTFCKGLVPHIDGRSTCGRLGIEAHKTAGVGDNGFDGHWTLELEATEPVVIGPGDRLFQVYFTPCWGVGLAHLIQKIEEHRPITISGGRIQDPCITDELPLFEVEDLYGQDGKGHYDQKEPGPEKAAPLD